MVTHRRLFFDFSCWEGGSVHRLESDKSRYFAITEFSYCFIILINGYQARNHDFMWGGANEAKVDQTTEMYFLLSDPFI